MLLLSNKLLTISNSWQVCYDIKGNGPGKIWKIPILSYDTCEYQSKYFDITGIKHVQNTRHSADLGHFRFFVFLSEKKQTNCKSNFGKLCVQSTCAQLKIRLQYRNYAFY